MLAFFNKAVLCKYTEQTNEQMSAPGEPKKTGREGGGGGGGDADTYSRLPTTRTLANWSLSLIRTKIDFPWISGIHLL